jgi:hypothetical protein
MEITKALLSHILINQLGISVETYNQMDIKQLSINEKYTIIVQFFNPAHVGLIYSKLNNLKEGSLINFSDYVPAELYKRHRDLNAICQILRKRIIRLRKY